MAYVLTWSVGGETHEFPTTSYYEMVQKKNALRKEGIKTSSRLTGEEKKSAKKEHDMKTWKSLNNKINKSQREKIRAFLTVCDKVERENPNKYRGKNG